ncbi:hypothetical protein FWG76_02645 [Candidatus Saccharibacteria bacterium]|nr:hypothetical protein [Candidatus Saccharibacteria bacterium]
MMNDTYHGLVPAGFTNVVRFEETFRSPVCQTSREDAMKVLTAIREQHSMKHGWVELSYDIVQEGKFWGAVRHHAQLTRA